MKKIILVVSLLIVSVLFSKDVLIGEIEALTYNAATERTHTKKLSVKCDSDDKIVFISVNTYTGVEAIIVKDSNKIILRKAINKYYEWNTKAINKNQRSWGPATPLDEGNLTRRVGFSADFHMASDELIARNPAGIAITTSALPLNNK